MIDIKGKRFNKLTVIEFSHLNKTKHAVWKCLCDCGKETYGESRYLVNGKKKSCGCEQYPIGKNNLQWKGCGELSGSRFHKMMKEAKKRNLCFEVSIEYLWDLFEKQNRRCALSNEELIFSSKNKSFDGNASLDRIDSTKGYTKDNVHWVHKDVNTMKWDLPLNRFLELVSKINNHKGVKEIGTSLTLSR